MTTTLHAQRAAAFGVPHPLRPGATVTSFSVKVVDRNGIEVAGEPVIATFTAADGSERQVTATTGGDGKVRLVVEHDDAPVAVTLAAGAEQSEPLQPPPGALLTLEL